MANSYFVGRRLAIDENIPITIGFAAPRGKAIMASTVTAGIGVLAEGEVLGFLSREVTPSGVSLADLSKIQAGVLDPLEQPDRSGYPTSLERWNEFVIEGPEHVHPSGTGAITSGTALGTAISWTSGEAYVKQSDDTEQGYRLVEHQTPLDSANAVRIVVQRISF